MIIYNLTIKVDKDAAKEFVHWLKHEHIPELMRTGLFADYRLSRLLEQEESEGVTYIAQYFCDNMEHYNTYIAEYAPKMREKSFAKFGNKFVAFRTVMEAEQ